MRVQVIRAPGTGVRDALMEENYRLRHAIFVELQGWNALRRPYRRDVDRYDRGDTTHFLAVDGDELVGGSRLTPLYQPNLLQTEHNGLVHGAFPAVCSLGADWTRCYVRPDRREHPRRTPESAALFCAVMEYALLPGLCFITTFSSFQRIKETISVGWRVTPLGPPTAINGRPLLTALIAVFQDTLANVRRATGQGAVQTPGSFGSPDGEVPARHA